MINNLMQIQDKLSQAPDDYLEMEITRPSGRVPLPLVFTEIQKRKQMRDGAMAKAKGNIMGLAQGGGPSDRYERGVSGLETLMAGPQQMPQTLPSMPEERSEILHWIRQLIKDATTPKEVDPRTRQENRYKKRPKETNIISPEDLYLESQTQRQALQDEADRRAWIEKTDKSVGPTSPESAAATIKSHRENELVDWEGNHKDGFKRRKKDTAGKGGAATGIGGLASSSGADNFFKALEDSIKGLSGAQDKYRTEMAANRDAYLASLKDPYADIIKQQQEENAKGQKWGTPLLALASGILSGRNLAQGLGQGAANMLPVLDRQNQEKIANQRYLQQLMLGQGQLGRQDAKDLFGINQDMAKTGYGMYGDILTANKDAATLGLGKERNEIARQGLAYQAAALAQRTNSAHLAGIAKILAIDTADIADENALKQIELMKVSAAKALQGILGIDDTEDVYDWTTIPGIEATE